MKKNRFSGLSKRERVNRVRLNAGLGDFPAIGPTQLRIALSSQIKMSQITLLFNHPIPSNSH